MNNVGYLDSKNISLAEQVRDIVATLLVTTDMNEYTRLSTLVEDLSTNLAEYLNDAYNGQFLTDFFYIPNRVNITDNKAALDYFLNNSNIANDLRQFGKNNDNKIGIIYTKNLNDLDESYEVNYTLFSDNNKLYIEYQPQNLSDHLLMPREFYSFLQRMGLTLSTAQDLYELSSYGERYYGFPDLIEPRLGSWPMVIEKGNKL